MLGRCSKCKVYLLFMKTLLNIISVHISICIECTTYILFFKYTIIFLKKPRTFLLLLYISLKNAVIVFMSIPSDFILFLFT